MVDFEKLLAKKRNMPRKIYDFQEAEPEKVLKAVKCSDAKCNFYFDLGTDDNKIAAGTNHTAKTGHSILMEYD